MKVLWKLMKALGVSNQAVSKWESSQCCPDIQLLPELAKIFDVTVDELIGYKAAVGLGDICLKIRNYFTELPERESFEDVYRIAALLHEIAITDGYKKKLLWKENKDYSAEEVRSWGLSIGSEAEGSTGRKNNCIFFTLGRGYFSPTVSELRNLILSMEPFNDLFVLKAMYALYGLTRHNFDLYVSSDEIAAEAQLTVSEAEAALKKLPVMVKEENERLLYRLEGSFCHVPSLLLLLRRFL